MPLDPKARKWLGDGPIEKVRGGEVKRAPEAQAAYRQQELLKRAGALYEDLMGFFLQQKQAHDYLDDECIAAVALFTINLREAYGSPQTEKEKKSWTEDRQKEKLAEFDAICEQMQIYYDENT